MVGKHTDLRGTRYAKALVNQAVAQRLDDRLRFGVNVELLVDMLNMEGYRMKGDAHLDGGSFITVPLHQQRSTRASCGVRS